ncbi:dihydrofolate reductase [Salsuginibacillus halophilus]|uniref:Dihydrofolate reductase n=1 Tax=Salsuginibacillus halophilus TaxID=517424 RepID=A0A2P8HE00_9BACI|nr:dihydrofolate reductase [Salsuginibacillus halophilus]PSL44440.1 dihydrofolate reductase [Salsuginibacillus halophilus]
MIALIAAMDENRVIGYNGEMPWHLPNDLKFFKQMTEGYPVVMGRKTFESIGRPLPKRTNVILTRDPSFQAPEECQVFHDADEVVKSYHDVFIIGGAEIYNQFLSHADTLYITEIEASFIGDTYFPAWDESKWETVWEETGDVDEKNRYAHRFLCKRRKAE